VACDNLEATVASLGVEPNSRFLLFASVAAAPVAAAPAEEDKRFDEPKPLGPFKGLSLRDALDSFVRVRLAWLLSAPRRPRNRMCAFAHSPTRAGRGHRGRDEPVAQRSGASGLTPGLPRARGGGLRGARKPRLGFSLTW
jgi:hypothetical protein